MIDLGPVECLIRETNLLGSVEGVLSVKAAIENGFNGQSVGYLLPLTTKKKVISTGTFKEYEVTEHFAVVVGYAHGGASMGGDNAELAKLILGVETALIEKVIPGAAQGIELGNGGLLPLYNTGCVFWQQEFSLIHYMRAY